MAANIQVEKQPNGEFRVTVTEGGDRATFRVRVPPDYGKKLSGGKVATEELVQRSFEFLLEREPKESILSEFELSVISRYFPEYESEIKKRLGD